MCRMNYVEARAKLSPCGLDCSRCADYEQGEIKQISNRLLELLGNYQRLAKLREEVRPVFKAYPQFHALLETFAGGTCSGCRGDHDVCPVACAARTCHKENKVDFCFQCSQFPCNKAFFDGLRQRWLANNYRMKEIGPEAYCEEQAQSPRY